METKIVVERLHRLDGSSPLKAFFDFSINDALLIKGSRIIESGAGLTVSLPREEGRDGKWYSTVIPLSKEVKEEIERVALECYQE
jgi:DNA-binding cell septation regulator SpoVG